MTSMQQEEYCSFTIYFDVLTDVISVWLLHRVHDFVLDRFICFALDPVVHLFDFSVPRH